ncbi:MAG: glycosyltransferase family 2 protein [Gammaproteobacteria bacterium]|nr:glycosyltransferase family 2 protein [Gammaproteobacteria bacterium]
MQENNYNDLTIIIPAKNEAVSLLRLLPTLTNNFPKAQIIVVNDGSTDDTKNICEQFNVSIINNPYSKGNGAAIKSGVRAAKNKFLVCMDADGQHKPDDIPKLMSKLHEGYDMVVGARTYSSQASFSRATGNAIYNYLASWMVKHRILDLTSGFRAVRANKFKDFLSILPNGFSYPTTITMAFFRSGFSVGYVPITAQKREGKSHINILKDGVRFLLVIFKIGALYSPLRIFFRASLFFFLIGFGYYLYTYSTTGHFTNMSALLFITSILTFLIGLVSEQITMLLYQKNDQK